jgi:hypothetical protein
MLLSPPHRGRRRAAPTSPIAARLTATAALLATMAIAPRPAAAQGAASTADDVLTLRSGTVLRGRIAEAVPGATVRIVLSDGAARTVPWTDLATTAGPSLGSLDLLRDAPGGPPAQPSAPAATGQLRIEGHGVALEIGRPEPGLSIEVRGRAQSVYRYQCSLPCTLPISAGTFTLYGRSAGSSSYRDLWRAELPAAGGSLELWSYDALRASTDSRSSLVAARRDLRLVDDESVRWNREFERIQQRRRVQRTTGGLMIGLGAASFIAGLLITILGPNHCSDGDLGTCTGLVLGVPIAAGGLVAQMVGVGLLSENVGIAPAPENRPGPSVPDPFPVFRPAGP